MEILLKLYPKLNLGDDLFLKMICERYPEHSFHLLADEDYHMFSEKWHNLHLISPNFKDSFLNKVLRIVGRKINSVLFKKQLQLVYQKQYNLQNKSFHAFVSIGGSIFMQKSNNLQLDNEIAFYELINKKLPDIPKFFIGCNFGPFQTETYVESYREIFRQATDVCFREDYSYNLFRDLSNVRVAPDVIFGLPVKNADNLAQEDIGISIVSPRNNINPDYYYNKLAELVNVYQTMGKKVYLFSFCKSEGDEDAINSVLQRLKRQGNIEKVLYRGNIDEFLNKYKNMQTVFCGRFHAMILSMIYGHKLCPLIYSEKMTNVLKDVGFEGPSVSLADFDRVDVNKLIESVEAVKYNVEQECNMAAEQFKRLDIFLERGNQ